jgi:NADH:ubiquinone oxidoreductase subunit E
MVPQITTNGSNFFGMWAFANAWETAMIDFDEMYSNDIHAILKAYGVEMARTAIVNEIKAVFKAYNISVDIRHLELIADYMVILFYYHHYASKTNSIVFQCQDV